LALVTLVACGQPSAGAPANPPQPEPAPYTTAPAPVPHPTGECPPDRIWDRAVGACRLFPGGGNGWAGCSQAKTPPHGEQCVSGTHWVPCDCECDAPGRWNPSAKQCEPVAQ